MRRGGWEVGFDGRRVDMRDEDLERVGVRVGRAGGEGGRLELERWRRGERVVLEVGEAGGE